MPRGIYPRKNGKRGKRGKYKKLAKMEPEPHVHAPKEKSKQEMFAVQISCPDGQLGQLLRCAASLKGVQVNGVLPIEERERTNNIPKGQFKNAVIEILAKHGGSVNQDELKAQLFAMGFGKTRVHSGIGAAVGKNQINRNRAGIITNGSWR